MKKYLITSIFVVISFVSIVSVVSIVAAQDYIFNSDLTLGSSGQDVTNLQTRLMANGYDIPAISSGSYPKGYFGEQTRDAVAAYQRAQGLPAYGFFGSLTRQKFNGNNNQNPQNNVATLLTVIRPNGGESWLKGTTQTIKWSSPYYFRATNADIRLSRTTPPCVTNMCPMYAYAPYSIASNIPINQNSYVWTVGTASVSGLSAPFNSVSIPDGQYTIQVCETGTSNCDASNGSFNVYSSAANNQQTVTLTSPNGGEVWQQGTTHPITWYLTGGYNSQDTRLDLYLGRKVQAICPSGYSCNPLPYDQLHFESMYVLDRNVSASMTYNWITATDIGNNSIPAGSYVVRACIAGSTANCDTSNLPFTISAGSYPTWPYVQCPAGYTCTKI